MMDLSLISQKRKDLIIYAILLVITSIIILSIYKSGYLFGSKTDWSSQHVVFPDYLRQKFYATGNIFPDFSMNNGGGQNIYSLSYYGLYSPIILISYLLPMIPMVYYITASSIIIIMLSVCLCYYWLRSQNINYIVAFIATICFLCAGPLIFHAHRHIMFMYYMPFLLLGLIGVDRYINNKRISLLIFSIFLCIMTSYFFSVGCILGILVYYCYRYMNNNENAKIKNLLLSLGPIFLGIVIAVMMSAILWLPTLFIILNGRDATNVQMISIFSLLVPDLTFKTLFHNPYSLGLTTISLIALVATILSRKRNERILSITLFSFLIFPIVLYILNGTLYLREKALIPLLPLYILIIALFLTKIIKLINNLKLNRNQKRFLISTIFLLIMTEAILTCLSSNRLDELVSKKEYELIYDPDKITLIKDILEQDDTFYRMNDLTDINRTSNVVYDMGYYQTSIYSSTFNSNYYNFYFDKLHNPINTRNYLILDAANNILFQNFMGVKYIIAKEKPAAGYQQIKQKGDYILYENENVLPLGYATSNVISEEDYEKIGFPYDMEVFFNKVIVEKSVKTATNNVSNFKIDKIKFNIDGELIKNQQNMVITNKNDRYLIEAKRKASFEIPLDFNINENIFILSFIVSNEKNEDNLDTSITINGVKNKLSNKLSSYPNKNNKFVFVISSNEKTEQLKLEFSRGTYEIYDLEAYIAPSSQLEIAIIKMDSFIVDKKSFIDNQIVGDINVKEDGYFATTLPYDKGFKIIVDGKNQVYERVNTAFVGFPIDKGQHHIVIEYTAPYKLVGIIISSIGFIIFAGIWLRSKNYKKDREEIRVIEHN